MTYNKVRKKVKLGRKIAHFSHDLEKSAILSQADKNWHFSHDLEKSAILSQANFLMTSKNQTFYRHDLEKSAILSQADKIGQITDLF